MIARLVVACVLATVAIASLARDPAQVRKFRHTHPCPATNKLAGACPGWVVDHIKPLCGGGADAPANMQWQAYATSKAKDKRELAYCACLRKTTAHESCAWKG
jgi:hypothetical protein